MILIFILLLFLLLTIFWYLLVRNIVYEDFSDDDSRERDDGDSQERDDDGRDSRDSRQSSLDPIKKDSRIDNSEDEETEDVDADSDTFTESDDADGDKRDNGPSYICLMSGKDYLNIGQDYKLTLGKKASSSIFKVIDHGKNTIQLESYKYPDYLLYFQKDPCFKTGKYAKESHHTVFIPYGDRHSIMLVTGDKKYNLQNKNGQLIFSKFNGDVDSETHRFKFQKARGTTLSPLTPSR